MKKIILASGSPRRRELFKRLGIRFKVVPSNVKENLTKSLSPSNLAKRLAYEKAKTVANKVKEGIVIGADTIVVVYPASHAKERGFTRSRVKGEIIGKPSSYEDAKRMLRLLSNTTHKVITAIAIIDAKTKKKLIDYETTTVRIRKIKKDEIERFARLHLDKQAPTPPRKITTHLLKRLRVIFLM
ncbi:MAG: Maf-like protein [Candidatus Omnitrophica bacterium]|nr:Maf-like protein [Candidatus Omnitrophota bacterium]